MDKKSGKCGRLDWIVYPSDSRIQELFRLHSFVFASLTFWLRSGRAMLQSKSPGSCALAGCLVQFFRVLNVSAAHWCVFWCVNTNAAELFPLRLPQYNQQPVQHWPHLVIPIHDLQLWYPFALEDKNWNSYQSREYHFDGKSAAQVPEFQSSEKSPDLGVRRPSITWEWERNSHFCFPWPL